MKCHHCQHEHNLNELELAFDSPDAVFALQEPDRTARADMTPDLCMLDGSRFFLRAVLPIPCEGRRLPFNLGLWVETDKQSYCRYVELYSDPNQGREPHFPATIANSVGGYWDLLGLAVNVQLVSETARPTLTCVDQSHPVARDQLNGISGSRALDILSPYLHPE